jgi:hypothetical protein
MHNNRTVEFWGALENSFYYFVGVHIMNSTLWSSSTINDEPVVSYDMSGGGCGGDCGPGGADGSCDGDCDG